MLGSYKQMKVLTALRVLFCDLQPYHLTFYFRAVKENCDYRFTIAPCKTNRLLFAVAFIS